MSTSSSNADSFYLTNGSDRPPIVHAILEPTSRTWQYVVVDPSTRHGVIIDPVYPQDNDNRNEEQASDATEKIIRLVEGNGWLIDHIFETQSFMQPRKTAAWSLRMHFSNRQGYAPQLCSNDSVTALRGMFRRRYGAANGFSTTLTNQYADKESFLVGRMRVTVMYIPGFSTPNRRGFLIDDALFGAYSIAMPGSEDLGGHAKGVDRVLAHAKDDDERRALWKSMHRVLSLPPETRVYYEEGPENGGLAACLSIEQCRNLNPYIELSENEFVIRRRGELTERREARAAAVGGHGKKNSWEKK